LYYIVVVVVVVLCVFVRHFTEGVSVWLWANDQSGIPETMICLLLSLLIVVDVESRFRYFIACSCTEEVFRLVSRVLIRTVTFQPVRNRIWAFVAFAIIVCLFPGVSGNQNDPFEVERKGMLI
jgi:hypothetical protein